jgi:hypothetical protein
MRVGGWAYDAGFRNPANLGEAIALAVVGNRTEQSPDGHWGIGGPVGDGPGQARAAFARYQQSEWSTFPGRTAGNLAIVRPIAQAVAASIITAKAVVGSPVVAPVVEQAAVVSEVTEVAGRTLAFLTDPSTWVRGAKILAGFVVIGGAMFLILAPGVADRAGKVVRGRIGGGK